MSRRETHRVGTTAWRSGRRSSRPDRTDRRSRQFAESITQQPAVILAYRQAVALWLAGTAAATITPAMLYGAAEVGAPILLRFPSVVRPLAAGVAP